MTISAEIICDSISPKGKRITTFILRYPRWLHPELMTHRAFSRNSSSSRAIPIRKLAESILEDVSCPIVFRSNRAGMQGGEPLPPWKQAACRVVWRIGALVAVTLARTLANLGAAKETANRLQESYGHISVVLTATEFSNWFALRCHKMAQPEIQKLANGMWELYQANKPRPVLIGQWHLPFVSQAEISHHFSTLGEAAVGSFNRDHWMPLIKRSVARCARVSYLNHMNEVPTEDEDLKLYDRLVGSQPIHASPAEHQASPFREAEIPSGNFVGWLQFRKTLEGENVESFSGPTA